MLHVIDLYFAFFYFVVMPLTLVCCLRRVSELVCSISALRRPYFTISRVNMVTDTGTGKNRNH